MGLQSLFKTGNSAGTDRDLNARPFKILAYRLIRSPKATAQENFGNGIE
jgi:hypothetical protein